jgi:hypothetical protein
MNKLLYILILIMNKDSFTYIISSEDRTNTAPNQLDYNINFGGFGLPYENYKIEVLDCVIDPYTIDISTGYLILTCSNLHENGVFCRQKLNANECIMAIIPGSGHEKSTGGNIIFNANNIRMQKQVKFRLLLSNFEPVTDLDINLLLETTWVLTLKLTPIID